MKLVKLKCLSCGASLKYNEGEVNIICPYCKTVHTVVDDRPVINNYYGVNIHTHGSDQPFEALPTFSTRRKVVATLISIISVFSLVFIFGMFALDSPLNSLNPLEILPRTTPESAPMREFCLYIFGSEEPDVEQLATLTAMTITKADYLEDSSTSWVIDYSLQNGAQQRVVLADNSDIDARDLEAFTGLEELDFSQATGVHVGYLQGFSLQPLKNLHSFKGNYMVTVTPSLFYDPANITSLSVPLSESGLAGLSSFTSLATLDISSISEDITSTITLPASLRSLTTRIASSADATWLAQASGLEGLENLTLDCSGSDLKDFTWLASLTNLKSLALQGVSNLKNIDFVRSLPVLESLKVTSSSVTDLSPLNGLGLKSLHWKSHTELKDLSALSTLGALEELTLDGFFDINTFSVGNAANLRRVAVADDLVSRLAGCPVEQLEVIIWDEFDCSELSGLTSLKQLDFTVTGGGHVLEVGALSALQNLETLTFNSVGFRSNDVSSLFNLPVRELSLVDSENIQLEAGSIGENPNIQSLRIENVKYSDISAALGSACAKLTGLQSLSLAQTQLADVSFVASLPSLQELNIRDNYVTSITPLLAAPELKVLCCGQNPIANLSELPSTISVRY